MNYTIIEDCSPYYIRFRFDGIENFIEQFSPSVLNYDEILNAHMFAHHKLSLEDGIKAIDQLPFAHQLPISHSRVSLFISTPGYVYRPHKDGLDLRCGINFNVYVVDDHCPTQWYSDEDLKMYPIDHTSKRSREVIGFKRGLHTPVKTMTAVQGECILFNTEIFHDWDNRKSKNNRALLTLRFTDNTLYYENARKILFGY